MSDLFKKFNVLVKARLNDLVGGNVGRSRRRTPIHNLSSKDLDAQVKTLRQRINEALDYEDQLQSAVQALQAEVARWDEQADAAVQQGNDASARYAIEQMQRANQRLTMAENDVTAHQLAVQELISRVNTLEAVAADVQRSQQGSTPAAGEPLRSVEEIVTETREKVAQLGDFLETRSARQTAASEPADEQAIEDDLERRRQRLSK